MKYLTTTETATRLGVSVRRVVALIKAGKLPSQRIGRAHVIDPKDLELVQDRRPGRPAAPS
jgi:excisionase family DNA binding protein